MERYNIVRISNLSRGIYISNVMLIKTLSPCRLCLADSSLYQRSRVAKPLLKKKQGTRFAPLVIKSLVTKL